MKSLKQKKLVVSIIKDDLINAKLIYSLNELGFDADGYTLHASWTLLKLMKIKRSSPRWDEIHERYLNNTEQVKQIHIHRSSRMLDALAEEIYDFLKQMRQEEKFIQARVRESIKKEYT